MDRRRFLLTSLGAAIAVPVFGNAQQAPRVYRIGWLMGERRPHEGLRGGGLRDLGYIEGENLIERRFVGGKPEHIAAAIAELLRVNVDVLVVTNTRWAMLAKQATC